jgi:hypothetical protein
LADLLAPPTKCPNVLKNVEARMVLLDPKAAPGALGRLLVVMRGPLNVCVHAFTITADRSLPAGFQAKQEDPVGLDPLPESALALCPAGGRAYLSGATKAGVSGSSVWRIGEGAAGAGPVLSDLAIDGRVAFPGPVTDAGVPGHNPLAFHSLAVTPDELQMAVSFTDAPYFRVALLTRASAADAFGLVASTSGTMLLQNLVFVQAPTSRLYGTEAGSGRLVELDLPDLRLLAGFAPPSAQGALTAVQLAPTSDQKRLMVSTLEHGELLQFLPETDSFLLPITVLTQFGALQQLAASPGFDEQVTAAWDTGRFLPLGRVAFISASKPPQLIGAGSVTFSGALASIPTGLAMVASADTPPSADPDPKYATPQAQLRVTTVSVADVASTDPSADAGTGSSGKRYAIASASCRTDLVASSLSPSPSMDGLWALVWPYCPGWPDCAPPRTVGSGVLVRLGGDSLGAGGAKSLCAAVAAAAAHPAWTGPAWGPPASLGLLASPDGRAILRVPGTAAAGPTIGTPSKLVFVPGQGSPAEAALEAPESAASVAIPALGADRRPCSPTFKPAVFASIGGGVAAFPLSADDCAGPWLPDSPAEGVSCLPGVRPASTAWPKLLCMPLLYGVAALSPSPNGRRLLAVVDNTVERRLVELDVDRDPDGRVRGLSYLRQTSLGRVSLTSTISPDPAGITFSKDGKTAQATVAGEATIAVVQ